MLVLWAPALLVLVLMSLTSYARYHRFVICGLEFHKVELGVHVTCCAANSRDDNMRNDTSTSLQPLQCCWCYLAFIVNWKGSLFQHRYTKFYLTLCLTFCLLLASLGLNGIKVIIKSLGSGFHLPVPGLPRHDLVKFSM